MGQQEQGRLQREYLDCPFNLDGKPKRAYVVYTLRTGKEVFGCKGVENGGCGRGCFKEGMLSLGRVEEIALVDAGIKTR